MARQGGGGAVRPFRLDTIHKPVWYLIGLLMLVYFPVSAAAESTLSFIHLTFSPLSSGVKPLFVSLANLDDDPAPEVITARDNLLLFHKLSSLPVAPQQKVLDRPITALSVADLNGDGHTEVLVGLANPGAIDVFSWQGNELLESSSRRYLFSSPTSILVFEASTSPEPLVGVTTLDGRIVVYRWGEGELLPAGTEFVEFVGQVPRFVGAVDLNDDQTKELVLLTGQSGLAILSWETGGVKLLWQNFPWGGIEGVTIGDLDQNGLPEIIVSTAQRILYGFGWSGQTYERLWQTNDLPAGTGTLSFLTTAEGTSLVAGVYRKKVGIWRWEKGGTGGKPVLFWSSEEVGPVALFTYEDSFYLLRENGRPMEIKVMSQPPVVVLEREKERRETRLLLQAKTFQGYLYLPLHKLLENRGWHIRTLGDGRTIEVTRAGETVILLPGQPGLLKNGMPQPTVAAPQEFDREIWLPLDLLPLVTDLNWYWQPEEEVLVVYPETGGREDG